MNKALTISEINRISGYNSPIILYKDLEKYDNIYEVFEDHNTKNFLILYQTSDKFGHWCLCFIRPYTKNKEIEVYDPYGEVIDYHLDEMKPYYKKLGSGYSFYPHLTRLLLNTPEDIIIHYNDYPHQKYDINIATCGRHCGFRLKNKFLDIDDYSEILGKKHIDQKITNLTNKYI